MGRFVSDVTAAEAGNDGFILLDSGLDAFVARAILAEIAEKSLDVQYYLYHQDLVGGLFTGYLVKAADRGVRVRILVDDMDMGGRDAGLVSLDAHPNIEVRLFNPFDRKVIRTAQFVTGLGSVTRRMHNKSFIADNQMTILGGRNIGNEYFDADPTLEFADLDVLAVGNVVREVSNSFDQYWNSALAYPVTTLIDERPSEEDMQAKYEKLMAFMEEQATSNYMTALLNSSLSKRLRNDDVQYYIGNAIVVVDDPEKITHSRDANELHLMTQLAPYFENLEKELLIVSPYFVPGQEGVEFFKQLIDNGVRVRILTNSLSSNDVGVVHAGYSKYRKPLLRAGVELYEMNKKLTRSQRKEKKGVGASSKASLHAKTFVLDREKVFIGSLNLDPRSFYENTEIGLVLDQQEIASNMAEGFDADIESHTFRLELRVDEDGDEQLLWHGYEDGEPVTFDVDPYTGFWRRFGVGIMRILPIESQL
jgi:putative cardiolipin synthase